MVLILAPVPMIGIPSSRQTTTASAVPHEERHTLPHKLFLQTSTRPSREFLPPFNLTSPSVHPEDM